MTAMRASGELFDRGLDFFAAVAARLGDVLWIVLEQPY